MAFSAALEQAVRRVAITNGIEPAALLAVAEIECGGTAFEPDQRTPRFLFERHVFFKRLKALAPHKLQDAVNAGLAHKDWRRTQQYKDLGSGAGRQRVLASARAIHEEAANQSCSWGVGQIMGFHAASLGYGSATMMVQTLITGGLDAQIDCFMRFIKTKPGLIAKLNEKDWAGFALAFNGPAYAANDYDTRLDSAHAKWTQREAPIVVAEVEDEEIPLGRTPVQNAEPRNPWTTPEGVATTIGAGTGAVGTVTAASKSEGPMAYALAFVIVASFAVGAFFFIKRMKAHPE
jgi:hypothetical protein